MTDYAVIGSIPAGAVTGTPLPGQAPNPTGVVLYVAPGDSVSYTIASVQPSSTISTTALVVINNVLGLSTLIVRETLDTGQNLYIKSAGSANFFRWLQGG